jgi:hypothetical protein
MRDFSEVERLLEELFAHPSSLVTNAERGRSTALYRPRGVRTGIGNLRGYFARKAPVPPEGILSTIAALANSMSMDLQSLMSSFRQSR